MIARQRFRTGQPVRVASDSPLWANELGRIVEVKIHDDGGILYRVATLRNRTGQWFFGMDLKKIVKSSPYGRSKRGYASR